MTRTRSTSILHSSRRQKKRTDVDRITDLPDSIIAHILSLLPTKIAVATSVLSKRWKLLWRITTNLDFSCPKNSVAGAVKFNQFVSNVLLLHEPGYLNSFSLTWKSNCIPSSVNDWISAAISRNVHKLFVCVPVNRIPNRVLPCILSCEKLQSLELNCNICISSKIVVSLPRLERLSLISVYFQSEEAFSKLIDACQVLKYLVIHMDIGKMIRNHYIEMVDGVAFNCIISSTSLRHLELKAYGYDKDPTPEDYRTYSALCGVELDAPSLEYIELEDQINHILIQKELVYLGEAKIRLATFEYETEVPNYCNSFVEAVGAFGCAKTLNLSYKVIRALSFATIKITTRFNKLTRLEVTITGRFWSSLQDIIELSNNLEVLIINEDDDGYDFYGVVHFIEPNWKNHNLVPMCVSNSLKTVSISSYHCFSYELPMVYYILKHANVLEVLHIFLGESISLKRKGELVQKISAFSKKSPICQVYFL